MSKRVYISADYATDSGDRNVVDVLQRWGQDNLHRVDFTDMSQVASGSVSADPELYHQGKYDTHRQNA